VKKVATTKVARPRKAASKVAAPKSAATKAPAKAATKVARTKTATRIKAPQPASTPTILPKKTAVGVKRFTKKLPAVAKAATVLELSETGKPTRASRRSGPAPLLVVPSTAINTRAAAEMAAKLLINHTPLVPAAPIVLQPKPRAKSGRRTKAGSQEAGSVPATPIVKRETGTFRQLKASLAKPASQQIAEALGPSPAPEADPYRPFGGFLPAKNQTLCKSVNTGADRTNLPRRKAG
jgi:hypothetical protein